MSRLLFGFALLLTLAPPATANSPPDFDSTIVPLFIRRCISCHSGTEPKGGLDITRRASVIAGESPVLIPGKANESLLWKRVEANEMPPKSPLTADEKLLLKSWIEAGAKWGRDPIRPRADADWWAFKPITKPNVANGEHPIDYFVRRELPPRGLTPTLRADRRTLIRRLFFDLTGLPPTNERIAAFESDDRPDAYEKLVDELLASPRYEIDSRPLFFFNGSATDIPLRVFEVHRRALAIVQRLRRAGRQSRKAPSVFGRYNRDRS